MVDIYKYLKATGIKEEWDFDKKRSYRQVNEFNFFLSVITLSALPVALAYGLYFAFFVQLVCLLIYISGFFLLSRGKLREARLLAIYTFEIHLFVATFFAVFPTNERILPWYSPVFIVYMVYPIIAALFDKPILKHMVIGLGQILLVQLFGTLLPEYSPQFFPQDHLGIASIIVCIYTIGVATLLIYLVYNENRAVKTLEIIRAEELQKALTEIEKSHNIIKEQAIELKKINDSKDKLFSILAHDLKSPYNVVLGFSEILKEKSKNDPEYREYAVNLYDAALTNYTLLENLLEWARTQLGHLRFEPKPCLLNDLVSDNINLIEGAARKKDIVIENEIDKPVMICADTNLVNVILRNLLTNSVKFTKIGGKISLRAETQGRYAQFSLKDNGVGMTEEQVTDLFMIEKKQTRPGTSNEKGTGLGLILCKEFIEMHGGRIWVKSESGKGTTFYFTLPLAEGMAEPIRITDFS